MNNNLQILRSVALVLLVFLAGFASLAQEATPQAEQGKFWVKIKPELSEQVLESATTDGSPVVIGVLPLDNLGTTFNTTQYKRLFRYDPRYEHKLRKHGLHLWYEVSYAGRADVHSVATQFDALSEVERAEPIYEQTLFTGDPIYLTNEELAEVLNANQSESMPFNDPYLPMQWHYDNTGQTGGYVGADINLFEAWKTSVGNSQVIVSIHDQGVDFDHEDLIDNMWINEAELNGEPMVDDDGNGFKDDVYGFNFADNKGAINPDFHGTHVAGTVGAMNNNGVGVAGVAGGDENTPGVKMMSLQIFGGVSTGNTAESYVYAANNGAVISQNSWGYTTAGYYNQAVLDAIDYFIAEAGDYPGSPMKGGVVFFAAGNNNSPSLHWPGAYENVICVSALDAKRGKASYSNFFAEVDLAAPGGEAMDDATMPDGKQDEGYSNGILSCLEYDTYGYLDGTSMACPHVSGIAALVVSKYGGDGFVAEKLKTHMLTAYNNIDTVPANEPYIGRLGLGASDAVLALVEDTKIGPETTLDLAVNAVTQEFAVIEWSVPADEHDDLASSYEILYAEQPITEATKEFARIEKFVNDKRLGEKVLYEVDSLKALTTYYFRIRSLDRWGNGSALSNEVSATTNNGPDAWIDKTDFTRVYLTKKNSRNEYYKDTVDYLPLNINAATSLNGSSSFNLHNSGDGLLRWQVMQRHIESDIASVSRPVYLSRTKDISIADANLNLMSASDVHQQKPFQAENDEGKTYITPYGPKYYFIGETDTTIANSSATRFEVTNPNGFNLTDVSFFLNYESSEEKPVVYEIYIGHDINDAKLTYLQEVNDTQVGWNNYTLNEQIYMNEGTYFWLAIHVPEGPLYPLGASTEWEKEDSKNCYVSLNKGKSWTLFEDLYYDNNIVWAVSVQSMFITPGSYLDINPLSGEVASNSVQEVRVGVDASEIINGTYRSNVILETNETGEEQLRAEVWLDVQNQPHKIVGLPVVDFGSVIIGNQKIVDVTLRNEGYGKFKVKSTIPVISDPQFEIIGKLGNINARNEYTFQLIYTPTAAGNASGSITVQDRNGKDYVFAVAGVGAEPPVMELTPASVDFAGVTIGDKLQGEFTISNTGQFPLTYYLPAFSDGSVVGEVTGDFCKYGYTFKDNGGGVYADPVYVWNDISTTGEEITDIPVTKSYFHHPVELSFDFPFFGELEHDIYINNYGMVTFDTTCVYASAPFFYEKKYSTPDRYISALGIQHNMQEGGQIFYEDKGDAFIIQYDNVKVNHWGIHYSTSYQIVLHNDGDITFYYKDVDEAWFQYMQRFSYFAIEDKFAEDGLVVYQQNYHYDLKVGDGAVIEITNPGLGLIEEVSIPEGVVVPGGSQTIQFTAGTDKLNVQNYVEKIPILTNDPVNNPGIFTLNIDVVAGGESDLALTHESLEFGQVFQGDTKEFTIYVVNKGRAADNIESAILNTTNFTLLGDVPVVASPLRKLRFDIGINSANLGVFEDVVTFTSTNGQVLTINLAGEVIPAPEIVTDITSITETLEAGNEAIHTVSITNNGGNNLEVAPIGNEWVSISESDVLANNVPEFSYQLSRSEDENGPSYNWIELVETGEFLGPLFSFAEDGSAWSDAIELPFEFNFYGQNYDKLYIGANGVLSFDDQERAFGMGPNRTFPHFDIPNNIMAAMWGFIYPYGYEPLTGIYYDFTEERAVIEWFCYVDGFYMADPISFQIILYPNGNFKFQYNMDGIRGEELTSFSAIGIENHDGQDGMTIGWGSYNIVKHKSVLMFTPVNKLVVQPGETKNIDVNVSAKHIYADTYHHDLVLFNNTPDKGELTIPVDLTVIGEASMTYPDLIDFGTVQAYGKEFIQEFELTNNGTKRAIITDFVTSQLQNSVVEAYILGQGAGVGGSTQEWMWEVVYKVGELSIEPNESIKLRVKIKPTTEDVINDNLIIETDIASAGELNVAIKAIPIFPPVISLTEEQIEVYAPVSDHTEDRQFIISNVDGDSDLEYQLDIQFIRDLPESGVASLKSVATISNVGISEIQDNELTLKRSALKSAFASAEEYNDTLQYYDTDIPERSLGYGGSLIFHAATRYQAPAKGFNLSHVQSWYVPGEWLNSDIEVKILAGSDNIFECQEIYSQEYNYVIEKTDVAGSYITVALDEPQLFYPEEYFFVVFKYPTGALFPQASIHTEVDVEGRYMYGEGEAWYDLSSGFPGVGWMMRAFEKEYKKVVWCDIVSELSGAIPAGEQLSIDLEFNAKVANNDINKAEISINSNDPLNRTVKLPVTLRKNMAPLFNLGSETFVSVKEGEELELDVIAEDYEGDDFTLQMAQAYDDVTSSVAGNVLSFKLATDFESAGIHKYEVLGKDEHNNERIFVINVDVINVNRAPVIAVPIENLVITLPQDSTATVDFNHMFSDPDGDMLQFMVTADLPDGFEAFLSYDKIIFSTIAIGTIPVTVTAYDADGETAQSSFILTARMRTGIDDQQINDVYNVYPNPVEDVLNVSRIDNVEGEDLKIKIVDVLGTTVYNEEFDGSWNNNIQINMSAFDAAVYFIEIRSEEETSVIKVIKQ